MKILASASTQLDATCYHCGLPVPANSRHGLRVDGQWRPACCAGCEAVARAILGQGLDDYYRLREVPAARVDGHKDDWTRYDHPQVQESFIRQEGGTREATLLLEGVRCAACVWLCERAIAAVPGVASVQANFATRRVLVRLGADGRLSSVLEAVQRVGYRATPDAAGLGERLRREERRDALWRLFVAAFGMMQVMMYAIPAYIAPEGDMAADAAQLMRWASFVLTVPVVFYSAAPFFSGAWRALRGRRLSMDAPVALGIAVTFGASVAATLAGAGDVYYDSLTMFVFLLLGGRYLETLARQRAAGSLEHLERALPEFAERLSDFPRRLDAERVPALALAAGDCVLVRPGECFPADGVVLQGSGSVSEALVTGESGPLPKGAGDRVLGGAVNISDALIIRIERTGSATVLAGIRRLVERASAEKPALVQLADRYSSLFVLSVLALALGAAGAWMTLDASRALLVAVSVLVATCPCAFSLATPAALAVATGELARRGVVPTRGHALESLARVTDVVLDKTGTVTEGELRLLRIVALDRRSEAEALSIAAALERTSSHPVARALAAAAPAALELRTNAVRHVTGNGVEADVNGVLYRLGSASFTACGAASQVAAAPSDTVVWLSANGTPCAAFILSDRLRAGARSAIEALRALGLEVHLLSGDSSAPTRRVAAKLGIARVTAEATPDSKRDYVRALQRAGRRVAMVGDGINDAPVLAQADVSLAMAGGTSLARAEADAVVLTPDLAAVADAVMYARRVLRVVRQNVGWAFAYNLTVLPLALLGLLTPWAASLGMSASSLVVILNALRLQSRGRA